MSRRDGQDFGRQWLPRLEAEMRSLLDNRNVFPPWLSNASHSTEPQRSQPVAAHYGMMRYHMGWVDTAFASVDLPAGKRIRPLLCLMACEAVGGNPEQALPAAAGLEFLHNFSLIHDDVEDGDEARRHRPTVWKVWGVPQAINAGDGMFALAFAALQQLPARGISPQTVLVALDRFTRTCVALTEGQHLDMSFEGRAQVSVAEYLRMIEGKTAALVATSLAIGALVGGAGLEQEGALGRFGHELGLAFQIRDDILGIWGDPDVTGKAAGNDIMRRKKSLPLLYALNHNDVGPHLAALMSREIGPKQVRAIMDLLAEAGARAYAEAEEEARHKAGLDALHQALGDEASGSPLLGMTELLLNRRA